MLKGLRDQNAVEWIAVNGWQNSKVREGGLLDWKTGYLVCCTLLRQITCWGFRERQLSETRPAASTTASTVWIIEHL